MKWLGSVLVCGGGFWWWRVCLGERRRQQRTLERLLAALYQLREGVRMGRMPLPELLEQLADGERFFGDVLRELRQREGLSQAWKEAVDTLSLPPESRRAWCWLGSQLTGDEQHVLQTIGYTEQTLERQRRQMAEQQAEAERRTAAVCFSTAALLVILLL